MGQVRFREADTADARVLWSTKHEAIDGLVTGEYTDAELEAWTPDSGAISDFRRAIDSDPFDVLVAEADGTTVGYGVLNRSEARIDAVFIDPEHSRQGIATSVMRQLESRASMDGIDELTLISSLTAQGFYERLGYQAVAAETRTIDGTSIEFVVMDKEL